MVVRSSEVMYLTIGTFQDMPMKTMVETSMTTKTTLQFSVSFGALFPAVYRAYRIRVQHVVVLVASTGQRLQTWASVLSCLGISGLLDLSVDNSPEGPLTSLAGFLILRESWDDRWQWSSRGLHERHGGRSHGLNWVDDHGVQLLTVS